MKIYCQTCGSAMEFSLGVKPSFCSYCGTSLGSKSIAAKPKKNITRRRVDSEMEEDFEDDEDLHVSENIYKLDFEMQGSWKQQSVPLGSILPKPSEEDASDS